LAHIVAWEEGGPSPRESGIAPAENFLVKILHFDSFLVRKFASVPYNKMSVTTCDGLLGVIDRDPPPNIVGSANRALLRRHWLANHSLHGSAGLL